MVTLRLGQTMLSSLIMFLFMTMSVLCSYNHEELIGHDNFTSPLETTQVHQQPSSIILSVTQYGAKGDGKSDDTNAFEKTWKIACSTKKNSVIIVPRNKIFLVGPITFSGPCKSLVKMEVFGTILASADRSDYKQDSRHWIIFDKLSDFIVLGGGTFNGNGNIWWKNSCKIDKSKPCKGAPTAVTFNECKNLRVENLMFKNPQQMGVSFAKSHGVSATSLVVSSPEWSPNTDGIHITASTFVRILKSIIKTGDDCISIESGTDQISATDITCGPGHGISIGSLGDHNSYATVSNINVQRANLIGTTNGVRIKTWQGGSGFARKIQFQDITMNNVKNPIIIDQNYCDQDKPCKDQSKAVQIDNVLFKNIKGTSASKKAISIDCSKTRKCKGIILQNINLKAKDDDDSLMGVCQNAEVRMIGPVSPRCGNSRFLGFMNRAADDQISAAVMMNN